MHGSKDLRALESGSKLPLMVGAVIYVRVSTKEQTENLSLPTQLRACEEYCRREGDEVLERFHEEGESAKTTGRSQLQNLLTYCRLSKGCVHFVVVFNLTRFARDKYDHFALRSHLQSLGISLGSATEPIDDDTSTGKLMEGVLAAFAQFDNGVRSLACGSAISGGRRSAQVPFRKAHPDPDFRYRSNDSALLSSVNSTSTLIAHGVAFAVCVHLPALCASSRARQSLVTPV